MNIAITGASGFVGRRLLEAPGLRAHRVIALSRTPKGISATGLEFVQGDLTSGDCRLDDFLRDCDVVYHCAGEIRDTTKMRGLHVEGTRRLLDAARAEAAQRGRNLHWVQLSSVGAYGPALGTAKAERIVTEETPPRPVGEYEVTKTESDQLVIQACAPDLMTYSIVRPSNVVAADMPNGALRALGAMVHRGLFFYIGRRGAVATYVHVDDVVKVLELCGSDDRAKGQIFNVSNDCPLEELVGRIALALGVRPPWLRLPEPLVRLVAGAAGRVMQFPLTQSRIDALVARTRYPYAKLERVLGFRPQVSVPDAIGEAMRT